MNIHLIVSSSYKLIDLEIKKIVGNDPVVKINLLNNDINSLYEELSYSFMSVGKKYVVVRNLSVFDSKKKNEDEEKRILSYLEKPNEDVSLVFVCESVDSRKKIVKLIKEKYSFLDLGITYKNIYDYINKYISSNGYKSDYNLSKYLVSLYALNLDLIFNELDKVFLYYNKPCTIDTNEIKKIISIPYDDNVFHFISAVINKDLNNIYKLLNELKIYKVDAVSLIILLAREYRMLFDIKKFYEKRIDVVDIMKSLKLQDWQLSKKYQESLNYNEKEILFLIKKLSIYDEKIKSGKIDKDVALKMFILDVIT